MRVSLCCITYNDHRFIRPFIKQIPEWVEKIVFCVSEMPWNGLKSPDEHKTWEEIDIANDPRVEKYRLPWRSEDNQRTWGLAKLYDYDWVIILDTDEFITAGDWETFRKCLETAHLGWNNMVAELVTYWKDFDHVFDPSDTHIPTIAVRPKRLVFFDKRCTTDSMQNKVPFRVHHLSWVRTDEEVRQKIQNYAHAMDFNQDLWYNEVWKKWTPEMVGIRPYGSEKDTKAILRPIPQEIRDLFG